MDEKIIRLKDEINSKLNEVADLLDLDKVRVAYLGKKGSITALLKGMKDLSVEEKKVFGADVNKLKAYAAEKIEEKIAELKEKEIQLEIASMPQFDITTPANLARGSYHPITLVQRQCETIFKSMGFDVEDYSEVVTDYECFESVNIPKHHPARDMQDTFWLTEDLLLRTHTSPGQIRVMDKQAPPIKVLVPGKDFRSDSDATHSPMFSQMEGLVVDDHITLCDLQGMLDEFVKALFSDNVKTRLRPSYFPFTEPSCEMDMQCHKCHGTGEVDGHVCSTCHGEGWIELLGAGMVHPEVLRNCGIDPEKYSGFAFGMGLERMAMGRLKINDLRLIFDNDMRFLNQF